MTSPQPAIIFKQTRTNDDPGCLVTRNKQNVDMSNYLVQNYRTKSYTHNPKYLFNASENNCGKQLHTQYDLQNVDEGQGAGMNPCLDSHLRFSQPSVLPADRLSTHVRFVRYIDWLPVYESKELEQNRFIVGTTIPKNPQKNYNPDFDIQGITCRDYARPILKYKSPLHVQPKKIPFHKPT